MLRDLGVPFTVASSDADEALSGGDAATLAQANAMAKVNGARLPVDIQPGTFVLGTDTIVTSEGRIIGKPASAAEAADMLRALSGRTHQVVSGVALARVSAQAPEQAGVEPPSRLAEMRVYAATTDVTFLALSDEDIRAYLDSGEWRGKAGGYAIQGLAALFVSNVCGEYSNVVGLPVCLLAHLFQESGFDLLQGRWT